jgi:hypothetical protein
MNNAPTSKPLYSFPVHRLLQTITGQFLSRNHCLGLLTQLHSHKALGTCLHCLGKRVFTKAVSSSKQLPKGKLHESNQASDTKQTQSSGWYLSFCIHLSNRRNARLSDFAYLVSCHGNTQTGSISLMSSSHPPSFPVDFWMTMDQAYAIHGCDYVKNRRIRTWERLRANGEVRRPC